MDVVRESFDWAFQGPLADVTGFDGGFLYAATLVFLHAAGPAALQAVLGALDPLLGQPTVQRRRLGGHRLAYAGSLQLEVDLRRKEMRVQLGQRIRGQRLLDLVRALGTVPGARDLRLHAEQRRFAEPGSQTGPMLE